MESLEKRAKLILRCRPTQRRSTFWFAAMERLYSRPMEVESQPWFSRAPPILLGKVCQARSSVAERSYHIGGVRFPLAPTRGEQAGTQIGWTAVAEAEQHGAAARSGGRCRYPGNFGSHSLTNF